MTYRPAFLLSSCSLSGSALFWSLSKWPQSDYLFRQRRCYRVPYEVCWRFTLGRGTPKTARAVWDALRVDLTSAQGRSLQNQGNE